MPEMVKGAENFLKSRSKPARTSVKITEIRPVAIGEGLLEINTKQTTDKTTAKDAEMKNFGLMNVENIKCEARPVVRNHSRGSNHRKNEAGSLIAKHKLNRSEINRNNIYQLEKQSTEVELEQYDIQSKTQNEAITNLNRKKTFSFSKSGNSNTADLKTENDEEQIQNLSKYSNSSNLFAKGNSNLSNRFEEIRQIELKYKNINSTKSADVNNEGHSSYIGSTNSSNIAVRAGMIVVGGQSIKPFIKNELHSKALPPYTKRGNTTGAKKSANNQLNFRKALNPNTSIENVLNPIRVFK